MSAIGHLAFGLAAKPLARKVPLWVLLLAAFFCDILYFVLSALGIEARAAIVSVDFVNGMRYASVFSDPWSHGLLMALVWAIVVGSFVWFFYDRVSGLVVGSVVFSHWVLDFLMHSNLPLLFARSPLVGLGLENSGPGFMLITALDLALSAAGLFIYLRFRKQPRLPAH